MRHRRPPSRALSRVFQTNGLEARFRVADHPRTWVRITSASIVTDPRLSRILRHHLDSVQMHGLPPERASS